VAEPCLLLGAVESLSHAKNRRYIQHPENAGLAWLTLVLGLRWQPKTKVIAALPGLATLATAVVGAVAIGDATPPPDNPLLEMLW
jgi:hypothetical protein